MGDTMLIADRTLLDGMRSLYDDGDLVAARRAFDTAYRAAERIGDGNAMAQAALGMAGLWLPARPGAPDAVLVRLRLRRALARTSRDASVAMRLRVRLAAESDHGAGGHTAVAAELAETRRHPDRIAHAEAAALARNCVAGPGHRGLRLELTRELIAASGSTGRRSDRLVGMLWHTVDQFLDGGPRAEASLADLRRELAGRDHAAIGAAARRIGVLSLLRAGRLDQAGAVADTCAGLGMAAGDPDAAQWHLIQMAAIRWYQGRLGELLPTLHEWFDPPPAGPAGEVCRAVMALVGDEHGGAAPVGADLASLPRTESWLARMYAIVECAHLLGEAGPATSAYDLLIPYAHRLMVAGPAVACFGSTQLALGLASLTTGRVDRAVQHLRAAVHENLALGHRPAATLSRWRLGQALARRGDRGSAAAERSAAASEAAEMGMILPEERAQRARPVGAAAHRPVPHPVRCRRVGQLWEFTVGVRQVRVPERRGVLYLAMLCASPGQEIRAAELVAAPVLADATGAAQSAQPVLDDAARREYRRRLSALRHKLGETDARAEHDWLEAELAATTGLGGRSRNFGDADERARISVGKAIRRALAEIEKADSLIGRRLREGVRTGVRCSYRD
jgi:hypothetical protein